MTIKIGLIGPTNIQKLSKINNKSSKFFLDRAKKIGRFLAEVECELWVNSDKGIAATVSASYKKQGGRKLVILYPTKSEPWPNKHARAYKKNADKLRKELNWFWANYNVVALPEICICAGLSSGTLSELAYIKWNHQLKRGKLKRLIVIKEMLRSGSLPPEIEVDIKKILIYINKIEELKQLLEKFSSKISLTS